MQWFVKAVVVGILVACAFAHAQPGGSYPNKPVRLISPFAPGSTSASDTSAALSQTDSAVARADVELPGDGCGSATTRARARF